MTRRSQAETGTPDSPGIVSLVGAGPGSPDLLTVRALHRLQAADVVFHDGLVPAAMLELAPTAECVSVARRAGVKGITQEDVIARLIDRAGLGQRVVRLKAGDPFVLGRGGEEAQALAAAGVPFEIVPGVSSATAAPALAGIPVTHRGVSSAVLVISGHAASAFRPVLGALPPDSLTVVVLMGLARRAEVASCLRSAGWRPATPVAVVRKASRPDQDVWYGALASLEAGGGPADATPEPETDPGVIVIGQVVSLATAPGLTRVFALEETEWLPLTIPRP